MPGYQFVHLQLYARATRATKQNDWVAADIVNEAERVPGNCPHVPNPVPPEILFGVTPAVVLAEAEMALGNLRDPRGRRIRKDTPCLLAGVASFPAPINEVSQAEIQNWERDCIEHLGREFGDNLKSVIRHSDEKFPHIHFYASPEDGRAKKIHPGHRAAATAGKDARGVFKKAMKEWQDRWHAEVSAKHGMARIGPRRQRLSRAEWKAQQVAAEQIADAQQVLTIANGVLEVLEGQEKSIAGRLRELNKEKRALDRRAQELDERERERRQAIVWEWEGLKDERNKLNEEKKQFANVRQQDQKKILAWAAKFKSEQMRSAQSAEQRLAESEKGTKAAIANNERLSEVLGQERRWRAQLESLLTPDQQREWQRLQGKRERNGVRPG